MLFFFSWLASQDTKATFDVESFRRRVDFFLIGFATLAMAAAVIWFCV